ncbi:hypothetical protein, partial [Williamsia deligens]|uniref:hypothetical protein n=1 Tax=Williamsia deligens TaxID=321325 RepID=UPI0020A35D7D
MSAPQNPFGHQVVDAMVPLALRIVGAVRDDDPAELLDAIATAHTIGDGTAWMTALLIAIAGLVP